MDMTGQPRLFAGETVAVTISAYHDGPAGWVLTIRHRLDGDSWVEAGLADFYSELTRAELVDVLEAELRRRLEL